MARWEQTIEIEAAPARVWAVMADVAKWPEWAESILSVTDVTSDFGLGGSAMVHAKGTPKSRFTVTRWEPGRGFDWASKVMGATSVGGHWIEGAGGGRSKVTLSIDVGGPIAALLKPIIGRGIKRNLGMEATGLKQRSEAGA